MVETVMRISRVEYLELKRVVTTLKAENAKLKQQVEDYERKINNAKKVENTTDEATNKKKGAKE